MKQKLNEKELDSLRKAKRIINKILKTKSMNKEDAELLSNAGASILFAAKVFDFIR